MKKIIALLIAVVLTIAIVATGLAGKDPATCPHKNCGWKTRTAAKCTTGGTDWYYCKDCGKNLYYKNTPALGHNMQGRTCTKGETCTRCGAAGRGPKGHSWSLKGGTYLSLTYTYVWHWRCNDCGQTADTYSFNANNHPKP